MIRFNYHPSPFERFLDDTPAVALFERLRVPLAIIAAALLGVAGTWSVETQRMAQLEAQRATLQVRLHATAAGDDRAQRLLADVTRLRAVRERIAAGRRDVIVATNTIASIGNDLPPQTWLTALGSTPAGDWTIGGRSTRVGEIGTMLRRVQSLDRGATARLISIAATGRAGRILDFVIGWERRP